MRRLGISVYVDKSSKEEIIDYIDKASKYGFRRIFSCLLSVTKSKEEIIEDFSLINDYAKKRGFEIIVDVAPRIFEELGISYKDLKFFKDIKADGLRLDMGFSGLEESIMTFNEQNLKIEINMSNDVHTIDTIMDYKPNRYKLYGCHNFYPHKYTGLSIEYFNKCTENFKKYGLRTASFISSNNDNSFGPWPVSDGLPTLEKHRGLDLSTQLRHIIALDSIDDIIISNCYPSIEELDSIKKIPLDIASFGVEIYDDVSEIERKIILEELHFNRGDISNYVIRSTQSRVKYKGTEFKAHNTVDIKRGDIIIESSLYGHYAGELQIALKDMKNSGKSSVVGRIKEEEIFILDTLKPWQKFKLMEN